MFFTVYIYFSIIVASTITKVNAQIDKLNQLSNEKLCDRELKRAIHQQRNTPVVKSVHVVNNKGAKISSTFYSSYGLSSRQPQSLNETKRFSKLSTTSSSSSSGIKSASSTTSISSSKSIASTKSARATTSTSPKKKISITTNNSNSMVKSSMPVVAKELTTTTKSMPVSLKKMTVIQASSDKQLDIATVNVSAKPKIIQPACENSSTIAKETITVANQPEATHSKYVIKRTDTITLRSSPKAQTPKKVMLRVAPKDTMKMNKKQQIKQFIQKCPSELIFLIHENSKLAFRLANFDQKLKCLEHIFLNQVNQSEDEQDVAVNVEANKNVEFKATTIPWLDIIKRTRKWIESVRTQNVLLRHPAVTKMMSAKSNDKTMLDEIKKIGSKSILEAKLSSEDIEINKSSNEHSAEDELLVLLDRITRFSSNILQQQKQVKVFQQQDSEGAKLKVKIEKNQKFEKLKSDWISSMPEDIKHLLENAINENGTGEYSFEQIYKLKPNIIKQLLSLATANARLVQLRNEIDNLLCAHLKATGQTINKEGNKMLKYKQDFNLSEQNEAKFQNLKLGTPKKTESARPARLRQQKCHPPPPLPLSTSAIISNTAHSAIVNDQEKMQTNFASDGDSGGEYTGTNSHSEFVGINRSNRLTKVSASERPQDEVSSLLEKIASCTHTIVKHKSGSTGSCVSSNAGSGSSTLGSTSCPNASGHNGGVSSASSGCCCSSTSIIVDQHSSANKLYQNEYGLDMMAACCVAGTENSDKIHYEPNRRLKVTEVSKDIYVSGQRGKTPANTASGFGDHYHNLVPEYEYNPLDENAFLAPGFMFMPSTPLEHILSSPSFYGAYQPPPTAPPQIQVYNVHTSTPQHKNPAAAADHQSHYDTPRRNEPYYANLSSPLTKPNLNIKEASLPASALIFDPSVDVNVFLNEIEKELEENISICSYTSAPSLAKFAQVEDPYVDLSLASKTLHREHYNQQEKSFKTSFGSYNPVYREENDQEFLEEPIYASIKSILANKATNVVNSAVNATERNSTLSHYTSCCSVPQDDNASLLLNQTNQTSFDGNWKLGTRFNDNCKSYDAHKRQPVKTQHFPFPAMNSMVSSTHLAASNLRKAHQSQPTTPTTTSKLSNPKLEKFRLHVANLAAQEADNHLESIEKWLYDNLNSALQKPSKEGNDIDKNSDNNMIN